MKKALISLLAVLVAVSFCGCRKSSDDSCSECGNEKAYLYEIDHIDKKVLEEKITVSYCENCYNTYLEKTFGKGARAKAEEKDAHFKDVVGSGGYLDAFE